MQEQWKLALPFTLRKQRWCESVLPNDARSGGWWWCVDGWWWCGCGWVGRWWCGRGWVRGFGDGCGSAGEDRLLPALRVTALRTFNLNASRPQANQQQTNQPNQPNQTNQTKPTKPTNQTKPNQTNQPTNQPNQPNQPNQLLC